MALISFGGSKADQQSSSEGFAVGVSGSESRSGSVDVASSRAGSQATESIAFADIFAQLFGRASETAAGIGGINAEAADLFASGTGFLEQLQSGGAGEEFLEATLSAENTVVEDQIGVLQQDLQEFFNETVLPGITSQGVSGFTLGGGREQVALGIAGEGLLEEFQRGSTAIRTAELERRDQAARDLTASQTARSIAGLTAIPGLLDTAQQGELSALAPFVTLAQVLGSPTVLGESTSFSESDAIAIAQAMSEAFGFDFSEHSSQSSGSSRSLSLGFS